jgi:calcium homeostasis ER protein
LALFVAKNGRDFEDMTRSKQQDNQRFAFLFGGEYSDYYRYRLQIEMTQLTGN